MLHHLLEVARGDLEGLLEGLPDAAVGLADQAAQLREGGLEILALALELVDVLDRLLVLVLGQRVHGADALAPALEPLEARLDLDPLLLGQRALILDLAAEALRDARQLSRRRGLTVADLGHTHLLLRQRLGGLAQPRLKLVFGLGQSAKLGRLLLSNRLVGL